MSLEFLMHVAATPLPKLFNTAQDIDAIKILRQAGLVLAVIGEPPESGARVLATTEKGRDELLRFHYPEEHHSQSVPTSPWLQSAAQRARKALSRAQSWRVR